MERIRRKAGTQELFTTAAAEYERGKLAPGSRQAQIARVAFWVSRAEELEIAPFPLDVQKIKSLGSLLHAGGYRSAASYLSAVKMEHIRRGGSWTVQMAKEVADGTRSCTRGQGPDKQSAEVNLDDMATLSDDKGKFSAYWPAVGKDAFLVMGLWLLREIEGTTARLGDVVLRDGRGCGTASWALPFSKMDVRALGCTRTHGCSCPDPSCPTAAMRRVVKVAELWSEKTGTNGSAAPLIPDGAGQFVKKTRMIRFMQHVASQLGMHSGVTGHACRVSGARRMARAGVDLWHIQLFARWESRVVLRYVREAPLATSHLLAARMAADARASHEALRPQVPQTSLTDVLVNKQQDNQTVQGEKEVDKMSVDAKTGQEVIKERCIEEQQVQKSVGKHFTGDACLPMFVLNTRKHYSRAKLHRPRDERSSYCGWQWASAFAEDHAITLDSRQTKANFCEVCDRLHGQCRRA